MAGQGHKQALDWVALARSKSINEYPFGRRGVFSPAVAAIPTANSEGQYLVVWEYRDSPAGGDIHAQRVAGNGNLDGSVIVVSDALANETVPSVAGKAWQNQGVQRFRCKTCRRTFTEMRGTIFFMVKQRDDHGKVQGVKLRVIFGAQQTCSLCWARALRTSRAAS
jgi:hypothetical protein